MPLCQNKAPRQIPLCRKKTPRPVPNTAPGARTWRGVSFWWGTRRGVWYEARCFFPTLGHGARCFFRYSNYRIKSRDCLVAIHQPAKLTVSYILTDLIDPLFKGLNLVSLSWILWNFSDLSFGLKGVACLGYLDFLILILVCYHGWKQNNGTPGIGQWAFGRKFDPVLKRCLKFCLCLFVFVHSWSLFRKGLRASGVNLKGFCLLLRWRFMRMRGGRYKVFVDLPMAQKT